MNKDIGKTLCVILHYGSVDDTNKCIESIAHEKNLDIIVVDNDPSQSYEPPEIIRGLITVIKTGGVAGFSEGNNIGVNSFLKEDHYSILILNNDTIVTKGALDFLRNTLDSSHIGAVGPCMPYSGSPDKIWACGGYINKLTLSIGGLQPRGDLPYIVDYLPGAAILCRSDLWRKICGFNKAYFLAYEEAELCLEIIKHGFKVMVDPRSVILHKVGMSSQQKPEYFYNSVRNRLIFSKYLYVKALGLIYGILITLASVRSRNLKNTYLKIRLWGKAVSDDISGRQINREIFQSIACRFGVF